MEKFTALFDELTATLEPIAVPVMLFMAAVIVLLLVLLLFRRDRQKSPQGFDRLLGVSGRVERLELRFDEYKARTSETIETLGRDLGSVRSELSESRELLRGLTDGAPPPPAVEDSSSQAPVLQDSTRDTVEIMLEQAVVDETVDQQQESEREVVPAYQSTTDQIVTEEVAHETARNLKGGLKKTRRGFLGKIKGLFQSKPALDAESLEQIEELLITSDLGVKTVSGLVEEVKEEMERGREITEAQLHALMKMQVLTILEKNSPLNEIQPEARSDGPLVVMLVGVNGVGKTTTAGKLAQRWKAAGAKVVLAAADTFRAAAVEQLQLWGERTGVPVVSGPEDSKAATVVYDAIERAQAEEADVLLIDTAGRLHTKSNLMQELEGIRNVLQKRIPSAPHEVLLVLDATTGQNALQQANEFNSSVSLSGLVITKLDGTPKGGIVVAIKRELGIPVRYIGVGESAADLRPFSARNFVEALFDLSDIEPDAECETAEAEQGDADQGVRRRRRRRA